MSDLYRYLTNAPTTGKARIPVGTPYFQDFHWGRWPEEYAHVEFDVTPFGGKGDVKLVAPGFGVIGGDYGCGAVHIDGNDWCKAHQLQDPAEDA